MVTSLATVVSSFLALTSSHSLRLFLHSHPLSQPWSSPALSRESAPGSPSLLRKLMSPYTFLHPQSGQKLSDSGLQLVAWDSS